MDFIKCIMQSVVDTGGDEDVKDRLADVEADCDKQEDGADDVQGDEDSVVELLPQVRGQEQSAQIMQQLPTVWTAKRCVS